METSDAPIALVTDQHPTSGIGVYATSLYRLVQSRFPNVSLFNLHYFHFPDSAPHQPISHQQFARFRISAHHALRTNERLFAKGVRDARPLVHLCGASYRLAYRVSLPIATVHDYEPRSPSSILRASPAILPVEIYSFLNWIETPASLRRCGAIVSISQHTSSVLERRTGLRSIVIRHWRDPERFSVRSKEESRHLLGLPLDRKVLLSVTAGSANKNLPFLRKILGALPEEYLLVKVGFPVAEQSARVVNAGKVSVDSYPRYFNAADAYVHCSFSEGFGRPLLESMESGVPVISLESEASAEVLGNAGVIVPRAATPRQFAGVVRTVVENSAQARARASAGLRRAEAFDPQAARDFYSSLYLDMLRS